MAKKLTAEELMRLDSRLNKIRDQDLLMEAILSEARRILGADAGTLYKKVGNELAFTYAQNDTLAAELKPGEKVPYSFFRMPIGSSTISGFVALTGNTVNVPNVYRIPADAPYGFDSSYDVKTGYRTVSMLTVALRANTQEILGVLQLINKKDSLGRSIAFSKDDVLIAEHFAEKATDPLERAAEKRQDLERNVRLAEMRDPKETGAHVNRVAGYAVEIYERCAVQQAQREGREIDRSRVDRMRDVFRMAAMMHDIGKVAISDTILGKPGLLDDRERAIMKTHARHGARLFRRGDDDDFETVAHLVALDHHEDWDGTGYPGKVDLETGTPIETDAAGSAVPKRGREISIWGQIVALADVYDALISKRVYKPAWSEERTLEEIRKLSGTKFDPELVDVFFSVLPSIKTIAARYAEHDEAERS